MTAHAAARRSRLRAWTAANEPDHLAGVGVDEAVEVEPLVAGGARPRPAAALWAPTAGAAPASARAGARRRPTPRPCGPGAPRRARPPPRRAFFVRRLLLRARRLGVPRPRHLRAVAELPEVVPAALRPHLAAEPGRHPRRHLRSRPQPPVGGRLGQRGPQRRLILRT